MWTHTYIESMHGLASAHKALNIISHNTLIWFIFSYQNTHKKSVNAVNKRARHVEPPFSFSICQGWGVFQQREEGVRGLEGKRVSFSILCSPENPIMKRHSTKSSQPSEWNPETFYPKSRSMAGATAPPSLLLKVLHSSCLHILSELLWRKKKKDFF